MSLINCLRRNGSEEDLPQPKRPSPKIRFGKEEGTWSGNLAPYSRPKPRAEDSREPNRFSLKIRLGREERTWSGNLGPYSRPKPREEDAREPNRPNLKIRLGREERSWSGYLGPYSRPRPSLRRARSRSNLGPGNKVRLGPPVTENAGLNSGPENSPRLVRSSGMRRDWSFEDVRRAIRG